MNETIETIRHEITVALIMFAKRNPDMQGQVDDTIKQLKAECCATQTDEQHLAVLKKWKHHLWVVGAISW